MRTTGGNDTAAKETGSNIGLMTRVISYLKEREGTDVSTDAIASDLMVTSRMAAVAGRQAWRGSAHITNPGRNVYRYETQEEQ